MKNHPPKDHQSVQARRQYAVNRLAQGAAIAEIAAELQVDASTIRRYFDAERDRIQEVLDERLIAQNIQRVELATEGIELLKTVMRDAKIPAYVRFQAARFAIQGASRLTGTYVGWRYAMPEAAAPPGPSAES